jgi:EAL and modified HD-GYP domain-containing signal transduction protein
VLVLDGQTRAQAQAAFDAGAHAVIGWPVDEPVPEAPGSLQPMQKAVLELIRLLQSEADPPDIERGFQAEPVMTYLLLTLANTPAFRRGANIASITQAITLLGYKRLLKWLVLLLVIASKGSRALPQIHTAVVRGFAMENLAAALGVGALRDEAFVAGAFSLLNRITGLEFDSLFGDVALPDAVVAAVTRGEGPLGELLQQARALESPARQGPALAAAEQRNTALLQAIAAADALQSLV